MGQKRQVEEGRQRERYRHRVRECVIGRLEQVRVVVLGPVRVQLELERSLRELPVLELEERALLSVELVLMLPLEVLRQQSHHP